MEYYDIINAVSGVSNSCMSYITTIKLREVIMDWTEEKIKSDLPDIKVNLGGKIYLGKISGSHLQFVRVTPFIYSLSTGRKYISGSFEVCWSTVTNCFNNNRPVIC